ncbi:carboxypeptidase-like regulatory domain-containing protein [uncultured Tenacibaculum sp.]|uniref:carboxypeptidase-like regulatory domain-containing protein n=1 Tax=uncultured Tenacibaculum sp. TaxID=174713 RepID=UPI002610775E|nr:carboxypeptidase-like regulatory domain-containing protein [uncultured Tenacibaculum sp.]
MGKISLFITVYLVFFIGSCFSQSKIHGYIKNSNKENINSVVVVLKDKNTKSIVSYCYSNEKGYFSLDKIKEGEYHLTFSSLPYKELTADLIVAKGKTIIEKNVVLEDNKITLDEVIVKSKRSIIVKKDTVLFNVSSFTDGSESSVEDLLKKIPGLSIDNEGTIKVGDREIEKLMVDGDDFFEKGYKVLSKNMPSYAIKEVEVLKRFSNNRLLKGIENSEKVALNLKLDENSKRIWFGNFKASVGNSNFYHFKGNLMNFGKKNKYYFLTNLNNLGYDAVGDVQELINPYRLDEPGSIGDDQKAKNLLELSSVNLSFNKNRTNFNKAKLLSINTIFNPTDKLKIKALGFFNSDLVSFTKNSIEIVNVNNISFENKENYKLAKKNKIAFGKLDLTYNISKNQMLKSSIKYNHGDFDNRANLVFNGNTTIEGLESKNKLFDQKITYTYKLGEKKVLLLTGRYINEKKPQNYKVNRFLFDELFTNTNQVNNVKQYSKNNMQFAGVSAHLLNRNKNGNLLELQLGNKFRGDKISSSFFLQEDANIISTPVDYQNKTTYRVNDLYFKSKYLYKLKKIKLSGELNFHQVFNFLQNVTSVKEQTPFFINPKIGFSWTINDRNKFSSYYSYNKTNAGILDVYSNYLLTGFRTFSRGINQLNQLSTSNLRFNYNLGNWSDRFFANVSMFYNVNHDFYSSNVNLNQNYVQLNKVLIKDRKLIGIVANADYYFKFINSIIKFKTGYVKSEYKNTINNSNLRKIITKNYNYGLELRSSFRGIFNYHVGTEWKDIQVKIIENNSFIDNISFVDLSFVFNKKFNSKIKLEHYSFGNLKVNNKYTFLDFESIYTLVKNKLTLELVGRNLFDVKQFRDSNINDIGTSTTEYNLLLRSILFGLEYRF